MGKIVCEKCKRKCRGDVLKVTNKYFHKGCFTCTKCNKSLEKGGFFMKDDGFYCQEDYQRYFVAKCQICLQDLIGEIVTVMNFSFHRECFKCTSCATPFHPGDRVTVWQERFFCPGCISQQQCVTASSPNDRGPKVNGNSVLSPLSVTDDEGCISAAEASLSEFASPNGNTHPNPAVTHTGSECDKTGAEFRLPSSDAKCISSTGVPQKSKSILRKSGTEPTRVRTSSREHGYLSTDSGLGERLYDSKVLEEHQSHTLALPDRSSGLNYSEIHSAISPTLSSHQSRQSLHARVPNSDYGRHLSQSYMNLDDPPSQSDRYKRNVSFTALNKTTKPKHFHIPEAKNRFLPPGTRTCELLFGQPLRSPRTNTADMSRSSSSQTQRAVHGPRIAHSAMDLDQRTPDTSISMSIPRDLPNGTEYSPTNKVVVNGTKATNTTSSTLRANVGTSGEEQEVTAEARRLACYPAGQQRDQSTPAPIERYDWPGPPASAVILAELMRERRYRRRQEQGRLNGTYVENGDDAESQDALSIDCGFDGHGANEQATPRHSSGIGRAILREELEQKRRSQSQQFLDPISASRTPNAAHEPLFKPRYSTHQFALSEHRSANSYRGSPTRTMQPPIQSGQPIRPGYTGGQLSVNQKTSSLPASSLLLNSSRTGQTTSTLWQSRHRLAQERPSVKSGQGDTSISDRSYSQSLHGLSQMGASRLGITKGLGVITSTDLDTTTPNGLSPAALPNGVHDSSTDLDGLLTGNTLSYPSLLLTSTPSAIFHRSNPPPPPKIIPYSELRTFQTKVPKGVDRTALETHLSEEEFEQVFRLSRPAFYRLPEWKRNDLKRRVNLF